MQNSISDNSTNFIELDVDLKNQSVTVDDPSPTISVLWDKAVQEAVIKVQESGNDDIMGPTIASRAYAMVHTAMYDAWSAYDPKAMSTQYHDFYQRPLEENTDENKEEAMSYAAYRVLTKLFPKQTEIFDELMEDLGFDPNNNTTDPTTNAGIGNLMAVELLEFRQQDGSNQLGNSENGILGKPYSDNSYQPLNTAQNIVDIERWTPEVVPNNGQTQTFLTPQWGNVTPFALESGDQFRPEAPQPFLLVDGVVNLEDKTITLEDGSVVNIDKSIVGTIINPEFIAQTEEIINISANLTDEQKLVAEFWEDAGGTSFPPGTWMTFGQFVSKRDDNTLDEDAQLFFGLGNAVFDAGIATWEAKTHYDYTRPVRAIRELGKLGLIGEYNQELGGYAIDVWRSGQEKAQTILATQFDTYQAPGGDPSPPFAEYTSGHSAFSAAGAGILERFTGSDEFGASVTFSEGSSRFEQDITPSEPVSLEWESFSEAADEAGLSRLYGGIHFKDGDENGRVLGEQVAQAVWDKTQYFINGGDVYSYGNDSIIGNFFNGVGDVDELIGGGGADTFILGDSESIYYQKNGEADFALIKNFIIGEDTIQLSSISSDYLFSTEGNQTSIFSLTPDGITDLIAVVNNTPNGISDADISFV